MKRSPKATMKFGGDTAMNLQEIIVEMDREIGAIRTIMERLKRENSILRSELHRLIALEHWELNNGMSEEEADRLAERDIVHMVAHNEGAE